MRNSSLFLLPAILLTALSCNQPPAVDTEDGIATISADSIKRHIAVLAADSFMGRKPFTDGETKTVAYLQHAFAAAGLAAGNGNSYVQEVPMVNILAKATEQMLVQSPTKSFALKAFDDYIIWTDKPDPQVLLDKAELVFAGYGVVAPEYNWNDYAGLDVKGKVVLVMVNDPGFWAGDTTLFKGAAMTYYGRWTYKFEEAARQGAKGCLIIHNTKAASYPFTVQQNNFNTSRLQLDNRGKDVKNCDVIGWVPEHIARRLFTAAGYDSTLLVKANQAGFKPVPLNLRVTTAMQVQVTYNKSYNVIGKIIGSKHPDEVIIYSAHWDHLGIGTADETGDSIYNGAMDNASGTAGLLELARAFKSMRTPPERTIVFLAVTAEEQGLLGSAYYAQNPVFPANKTVADINIDGLNPFGKTKDIVVIGAGQSDLEDYLKEAIAKDSGYISFETHPEAGYYYRSDHFNFAKAGIPSLFTETGIDVVGKDTAYGKKLQNDFTTKHYHRPSDTFNATSWTMEGAVQDLRLLFRVGRRLAFKTTMPEWKPGSEFRTIRQKTNRLP
jgi:Zn-dependent M28 family amino/carboxypeptidase